ncbi:MAG TPA: hypothetical protein VF763_14525 [Candidatus Limnocylindrales bacterium]
MTPPPEQRDTERAEPGRAAGPNEDGSIPSGERPTGLPVTLPVPGFLRVQPEEVWFFLRISAYAFFIGTVYWVVSYEAAGTMLLFGFGLAAGFGTLILALGARSARRHARDPEADGSAAVEDAAVADVTVPEVAGRPDLAPDGPFGDESGRIPSPTLHPLGLAFGVALAALGLVFGPWLIIPGLAFALVGALGWGSAAMREYLAVAPPRPAPGRRRRGDWADDAGDGLSGRLGDEETVAGG